MAKNNWNDYSATAASNTDIGGIDIDENCVPSNINDALRTVLAHTADVVSGTVALSSINIDGGSITGITDLAVADGGTGASTLTANGVLFGNGTSAIGVTAVGTAGQVLTSNGSSAPTFQDAATTYTHPNHSGEVTSTGDGATVIASNVVDEDNLKVSNSPTNGYILTARSGNTGGLTWEAAAGGGASDIDGLSDGYANKRSIGLGANALANLNDGYEDNIAIGENALNLLTTGSNNIAIGPNAGSHQYGTLNKAIMIGRKAGASVNINTGSSDCVLVGMEVGQYGDCDKSIILGHNLCNQSGSGSSEAVIISGNTGGGNHTEGTAATHVGYSAGSAVTTGTFNTMLGHLAGSTTTTASNVTCLGRGAVASGATTSNEITLGNSSISSLRCQVQTISSLSDLRDKKDIEELPLGIDFINTLKPVKFTWNMRDGAKVGQKEAGFIAQDLDKAQIDADAEDYLNLVLKNNPEKLEASYGKLVPVLVKAVQELSAEIATLKKELSNV